MKIYHDENSEHLLTSPTINPYWDEIKQLEGDNSWGRWRPGMLHFHESGQIYDTRTKLVQKYSWAIPDPETLRFVVKHAEEGIVEIGSGMGYWKWQLEQYRIQVVGYDIAPPDRVYNQYHSGVSGLTKELLEQAYRDFTTGKNPEFLPKVWSPMIQGGAEMSAKHPNLTLFLCWPVYDESMAYDALRHYTGKKVIYIGEGQGGCTGDDMFHALLDEAWEEIDSHSIVQWEGMHDHVYVYTRKEI